MVRYRKILVPIDGSPPSVAALEHAVVLVDESDATIVCLHVEAPDEFELGSVTPSTPAARQDAERVMTVALERAVARLGDRLMPHKAHGDPFLQIIEFAADGDFDLIVMGTHGRIGRLHAILGSVAEGVVRSAPCPVLTVRAAGGAEQSFAERLHHTSSVGDARSGDHHHR